MKSKIANPLAVTGALALAVSPMLTSISVAAPVRAPAGQELPKRASAKPEDESQIVGLGTVLAVIAVGGAVVAATVVASGSSDSNG
ncbi:hypothetical protein [Croceicoccus naphthovorans]|uniref:Uncharacterized protein n=1 Tax=Croceicoccus naphthovorans TaxID=1348774 RepID=A0A0G3XDF8_9SPHN|nr:hypothetical protein [Croceicoccus naphthovorans]AKM09222.1 hypothetical protein AB433_03350 [Croceicoccus naphthovorans]MBB3990391.1 hypothetical protein [Croceicoccus naphthovorans]